MRTGAVCTRCLLAGQYKAACSIRVRAELGIDPADIVAADHVAERSRLPVNRLYGHLAAVSVVPQFPEAPAGLAVMSFLQQGRRRVIGLLQGYLLLCGDALAAAHRAGRAVCMVAKALEGLQGSPVQQHGRGLALFHVLLRLSDLGQGGGIPGIGALQQLQSPLIGAVFFCLCGVHRRFGGRGFAFLRRLRRCLDCLGRCCRGVFPTLHDLPRSEEQKRHRRHHDHRRRDDGPG